MNIQLRIQCVINLFFIISLTNAVANPNKLLSKTDRDPRIVGGQPILIESAPWQVSVRLTALEEQSYGSVTYRSASEFTLVMGSTYLTSTTYYTLQYYVLQIIVNPNFDINTLANDAALFFINGYIPWNWPTVQAIPLNTQPIPSGTLCTVSGWGSTGYTYVSNVLMEATVPIVNLTTCETNYGNLSAGMMCAGYMQTGGVDACQGDSGGPLACNGVLAGIVSWGEGCATVGYPGVYTNVSYFYNWIVASNNSLDYSYYYYSDDDGNGGGNGSGNGSNRNFVKFISFLVPAIILIVDKYFQR